MARISMGKNNTRNKSSSSSPIKSDLKANGAKYSTTNRNGITSYYASSKDVDNGRGPIKSVNAETGEVITSQSLVPQKPIQLPTPSAPIDGAPITNGINAGLASISGGGLTYDSGSNQFQVAPPPEEVNPDTNFSEMLKQSLGAYEEMGNSSDRYAKLEKDNRLKQKRETVNSLTGQLNSIVAERDANVLRVEGQGRGIPEAIIGGQQAQINREAAIRALPVQAQLAAAQGDLEMAQTHVDRMFQLESKDAENLYNFKTSVIKSVYEYADAQQQRALRTREREEDRAFDIQKTNLALKNDWAKTAIEYGQSSLAGSIMQLDANDEDFESQLGALQKRVSKPVSASKPDLQNFGTSDNPIWKQYNAGTGTWDDVQGITPTGGQLKQIKDKEITDLSETWTAKNSLIALVDSLQKNIKDNGTQVLWGTEAGNRSGDTTNLLLAMKNLEKTGALDKGTIDVLAGTIPGSKFFATEKAQIAALESIKETVVAKVDEYVGSYRGTSAETDPRTQRIYGSDVKFELFDPSDIADLDAVFGVTSSTNSGFNPASYY